MQRSWVSALIFSCAYASATACTDVTASDAIASNNKSDEDQECARNTIWAQSTGITTQPELYVNYSGINVNSSFTDFQCVLWVKHHHEGRTDGHNCAEPCTASDVLYDGEARCKGTPAPAPATPPPTAAPSAGWPWWAWLLLVGGILALLGGLAYFFLGTKKGPEKKKKKKAAKPPAPQSTEPTPVPTTTVPMVTYQTYSAPVTTVQAPPVMTVQAAPVYVEAQPTYVTAAPSVSYAAPVTYAAPAAPMTTYVEPSLAYTGNVGSVAYAAPVAPTYVTGTTNVVYG